jgi:MFS family permease
MSDADSGGAEELSGARPDGTESAPTADEPSLWRNLDFVRFFLGQFVTNAGDSLYAVAALWLVFELSGSSTLVGVASATLLSPYLLQIVAGPVVDRLPLKPVLLATQVGQGLVVLVLPLAAVTGQLSVPLLFAVVPVLALLTVPVSPVRAALVPRIVREEQLARGNAALSTVTLGLDMVFDALGGAFVAVFGATALFVLDSATFALATLLFAGMTVPDRADTTREADTAARDEDEDEDPPDDGIDFVRSALATYRADLREGVAILQGTLFVETVLTSTVSSLAVGVTLATLPAFGASLGGPAVYGLLLGALGVGRLVGSASASWLDGVAYGPLTVVTYLAAALAWVASVYAPTTPLTVVLFGLAWIAGGIQGVLISTLNQRVFPADLLGRVSSIKGTVSTATLPLGSLVGGVVAETLGPTATMTVAAGGFAFVGCYFALRPPLRRLPAVAVVEPSDLSVDLDREPAAQERS